MALTPAQLAAFKTAILADTDQAVIDARAIRNDTELARLYNLPSTFVVWKTSVSRAEMHAAYDWTEMDGFSNSAKQYQFTLLLSEGTINPSKANVRTALSQIFSGAGFATTRAALIALGKRFATKAEKVFATGTGTDATPGSLVFEGTITIDDVGRAMNG